MSFITSAAKQVTDVRSFLRDSAGGNSIKYKAEKGKKHLIYFPYEEVPVIDEATNTEKIVKRLVARQGKVHEWNGLDGKYKAVVCLKGVVIKDPTTGDMINDGSCPFCDRVTDAWDIYNYRKELEEANCKLTGEERKKHLEKVISTLADDRKAKAANSYMYTLVVKFRTEGNKPVIGEDNLPEYDLKIMKMSANKVESLQQTVENSGAELEGCEIVKEYKNIDDIRSLVSQSTTALVMPDKKLTALYPQLKDKINADVKKFDWEGLSGAFREWEGMTSAQAANEVKNLFANWDSYKKELQLNPNAKYMEYVSTTQVSSPELDSNAGGTLGLPDDIPVVPDPSMSNIADPNSVFDGGAVQL